MMKCQNESAATIFLATLFLLGSGSSAQSQHPNVTTANNFDLTVQVVGVKQLDGKILIGVFNKSDGFPKELKKALLTAKANPDLPTYQFNDLKRGDYAVVVIHDRNNNGKLDRNFLGIPKEPVGISNYMVIGISNPPTFKNALFALNSAKSLKINLNSFK